MTRTFLNATTQAQDVGSPDREILAVPGLVVIFANHRARCRVFRWEGTPIELGRQELAEDDVGDPMISRKHARLRFDGVAWQVSDLGSRNRTLVGARPVSDETTATPGAIVRIGGALLAPIGDTLKFQRYGLGLRDGVVGGPSLREALETIAVVQKAGILRSLLISGESGTGKEIAAKTFHASGPKPNAPFVAVNCGTIPEGIAERLLFGSRRGAFNNAIDAPGYVQTADGGTLFLDEVAELSADVQTKLLRVLEMQEVMRLGATSYERVNMRVCAASWRDLRQHVATGRFREDLYFRIAQPEIRLPALRTRIEEIPWHIQQVLDDSGLSQPLQVTAPFVEACCLRVWPGNVRELRAEVRRATATACAHEAKSLTAESLSPEAGKSIAAAPAPRASTADFPDDEIAAALSAELGNVVAAARRLGVQRNKVRRWLERHGVDARRFQTR